MNEILEVVSGKSFQRTFEKFLRKDPQFSEDFKIFFREFCKDPNNKKFKLHKLKGKLSSCYSAKIKYDLRLIFEIEEEKITLIDIGTHDKVY